MTPEARIAAAAEILDRYLDGEPAEKALTNWSRRSRFAGSKDRAAVRDHVFEAIRRQRSASALGGALTGRGLMIGLLRSEGKDPASFLTGEGYALSEMSVAEAAHTASPDEIEALDCPEWLAAELRRSLGDEFSPVLSLMRSRADVFLRVNIARSDPKTVMEQLAGEGIVTEPHPLAVTALRVLEGARKVQASSCYRDGLVEVQDAASQAVAEGIPVPEQRDILDYCAGGGGKSLALAARSGRKILAHDANPGRMKDLPERARRAGCDVVRVSPDAVATLGPQALVVADVPCSGSGAWRRQPESKWRLDPDALQDLRRTQFEILEAAAALTEPGGCLAYITCSLLKAENEDQVARFVQSNAEWTVTTCRRLSPLEGGDGFFLAVLTRKV